MMAGAKRVSLGDGPDPAFLVFLYHSQAALPVPSHLRAAPPTQIPGPGDWLSEACCR